MQRGWVSWGVGSLTAYHLLACFLVYQTIEVDGGNLRAELRTRLLLNNIRTHLAKQVDEVVAQKECDSGLVLCESPKEKEASPEESQEDVPPPPKIRGLHKPAIKVNPKDVIQTMIHKPVHKPHIKRPDEPEKLKIPVIRQEDKSDDSDDDDQDEDEDEDEDDDDDKNKNTKGEKEAKKKKEALKKEEKPKKKQKQKQKEDDDEEEGISFPNDLPVFAPTSSAVESEICRKHSRLFLRQLERYKMWALLMYDASAKFPSGVLQGNVNQFGDFDECLTVNAVLKDKSQRKEGDSGSGGIQGRYCLAAIDIEASADEGALQQAVNRAEAYGFVRSKADDAGYFIPRFTTIKWGVCVPSSCSPEDVEKALKDELSVYNDTAGVTFDVLVEENACADREDLDFSFGLGTFFTTILYLAVIGTAGYATYRDLAPEAKPNDNGDAETKADSDGEENSDEKPKEAEVEANKNEDAQDTENPEEPQEEATKQGKLVKLLMAFSCKRTIAELLSPSTDDDIACIHGIKAIFTVLLYIAHKTVPLALTPYHNRILFTKLSNEPGSTILRTSIIYTDSFLLVSGVLTSYNLTREILAKGRVGWLRRFVARFIRLTPPLLAVILFYSYFAEELSSGPQWGSLVGKNAELCRENSWSNLLYIQNFFNFEEMCAPQTHQLALDMQLSLTAPLLVYVLYHYDLIGLLILQFVFLLSSALRYITTSNNELTLVFYHGVTVSQLYETANLLYSQAIYRATPYVLGVTIGYYLRKQGDNLQERLHKPLAAIGWILATCFALLSVLTPAHLADRNYVYNVQEAAQYAALSPISWSLALGWVIAACHLGKGGRMNDFLSSRPLLVFSRISYSVYLIQFLVFNHNIGIIRTPKFFSITEALDITEIATIIVWAFIVTILFDIPMKEVKCILLERSPAAPEADAEDKGGEDAEKESPEDEQALEEEQEDQEREESIHDEEMYLPEDDEGPTYPPGYEEDELDPPLRRSSRVRFDEGGDEKNFWVPTPEPPLEDEEIDGFWAQDED